MASNQNTKAIDAGQVENVDKILIKPHKIERISEYIQKVIDQGIAKRQQANIIYAIRKALEVDGIPALKDNHK